MNKANLVFLKIFRIVFAFMLILSTLGSIIAKAPIYVPILFVVIGSGMVWVFGKSIKIVEKKES